MVILRVGGRAELVMEDLLKKLIICIPRPQKSHGVTQTISGTRKGRVQT